MAVPMPAATSSISSTHMSVVSSAVLGSSACAAAAAAGVYDAVATVAVFAAAGVAGAGSGVNPSCTRESSHCPQPLDSYRFAYTLPHCTYLRNRSGKRAHISPRLSSIGADVALSAANPRGKVIDPPSAARGLDPISSGTYPWPFWFTMRSTTENDSPACR